MTAKLKKEYIMSDDGSIDWEKKVEELKRTGAISNKEAKRRINVLKIADRIWKKSYESDGNKCAW